MRLSRRILNDLSDEYIELLSSIDIPARRTLPAMLDALVELLASDPTLIEKPGPE